MGSIRFEAAYHPSQGNILACVKSNQPMSFHTAEILCASSVGLYQIMLDNVYSLGYRGTVLNFWSSPELQLSYFNLFIKKRGIDYLLTDILNDTAKRDNFSKHYNGALSYGDRLMMIFNASKKGEI